MARFLVQTIPNKLPELLIDLSSQGPHLMANGRHAAGLFCVQFTPAQSQWLISGRGWGPRCSLATLGISERCVMNNTFSGHNTFIILFPTWPRAFFLALICSGCNGLWWADPRVYRRPASGGSSPGTVALRGVWRQRTTTGNKVLACWASMEEVWKASDE